MLHIIATNSQASINYCQQCLLDGDSILFIEDGVYLLLQNKFAQIPGINYYALKDFVDAFGLEQQIPNYIKIIDYDKFVELTEIYPRNQMW